MFKVSSLFLLVGISVLSQSIPPQEIKSENGGDYTGKYGFVTGAIHEGPIRFKEDERPMTEEEIGLARIRAQFAPYVEPK